MAEAVAATSWQFLGWTGTAEMVAPLANMVESALAGGVLPILQPPGESAMVAASTNADLQGGVGGDDAGRAQGERFALELTRFPGHPDSWRQGRPREVRDGTHLPTRVPP